MAIQEKALSTDQLIKPLLRGHFHQAAFFAALGACSVLIAKSADSRSLVATLIYSLCLIGLFGVSALYHRPNWSAQKRAWMRRLDHSSIFLLIAGTTTPVALLALSRESGAKLLALVWVGTGIGILQTLFWLKSSKWLTALLAIGIGWLAAPFAAEIGARLGWSNVALLVVGGVLYTIGAIIYATKRPNPSPRVFGYHEIFHVLVIVAAIFHFIVITRIAT